jgi:DNA invertase Pin-like site-specific DNA recombinase
LIKSCSAIYEEKAAGDSRARPQLTQALYNVKAGDKLVMTKIDQLAPSLARLLEVIERLTAIGGTFKSLSDPIDTTAPIGAPV